MERVQITVQIQIFVTSVWKPRLSDSKVVFVIDIGSPILQTLCQTLCYLILQQHSKSFFSLHEVNYMNQSFLLRFIYLIFLIRIQNPTLLCVPKSVCLASFKFYCFILASIGFVFTIFYLEHEHPTLQDSVVSLNFLLRSLYSIYKLLYLSYSS